MRAALGCQLAGRRRAPHEWAVRPTVTSVTDHHAGGIDAGAWLRRTGKPGMLTCTLSEKRGDLGCEDLRQMRQ